MKKVILGLALCGLALGCKTDKQAAIEDAATPTAESSCASACSDAKKAECAKSCSDAEKAECATKKTCPVTGEEVTE